MKKNLTDVEILLVEDNSAEAKLTMRALEKSNIANQLIWLKDGEEAEHFLLAKGDCSSRDLNIKPRLILLDLKLPKVSGLELLKMIKSNVILKTIPVVVLTSSLEDSDLKQCYDLGVNSYIVKPVSFDQFTKVAGDIGLYWMLINKTSD